MNINHAVGYFDDKYGGFGRSRSDLGSNLYGKWSEESPHYDSIRDEGRKVELYGARGTAPKSSTWAPTFDHYEVDRFRFRKGFDGDFEFEQDREGCP